jgi:hypothetical protein
LAYPRDIVHAARSAVSAPLDLPVFHPAAQTVLTAMPEPRFVSTASAYTVADRERMKRATRYFQWQVPTGKRLTAYSAVAAVLICREPRVKNSVALYVGAMLAFASASKFLGLVISALSLVAYSVVSWRRLHLPIAITARRIAIVAVIIANIGLPWWIRSWIHTGRAFYPFFSRARRRRPGSAASLKSSPRTRSRRFCISDDRLSGGGNAAIPYWRPLQFWPRSSSVGVYGRYDPLPEYAKEAC